MSNTGGTRAWRFLKRNPHYIKDRREAPAAAPDEAAPFPIRARTTADRKAAAWGLMAWEEPLDEAQPASPFWTVAPTMRGFPVPGAPPLTELLEGPDVRLSGLRLESGPVIVRIAQGDAAVHVRIEDWAAFDPAGGIVYGFDNELELGLRLRRGRRSVAHRCGGDQKRRDRRRVRIPDEELLLALDGKLGGKTLRLIAVDLFGEARVAENWDPDGTLRAKVRWRVQKSLGADEWRLPRVSRRRITAEAGGRPCCARRMTPVRSRAAAHSRAG